jgi:NAD(P)H-quinone oxidoreductase subunit 5
LSVHLGAFLLLRVSPILDRSPLLGAIVVTVGLATAVVAMFVGRAQTDVKSALSFAALTQVGLIVAEIGLGLRYFALAHLIGHASLRTLQFLRASSVLADYRTAENAIGGRLPRLTGPLERLLPAKAQHWLYRFSMERGYLDAWLSDYVARPFLKTMQACDRLERGWTDWLAGGRSPETDARAPIAGALEDLS